MDAATTDPTEFRAAPPAGTFTSIAVADIRASPYNHRKTFTGLEELGDSIATKGLAQPIVVRRSPPPAAGKRGPKLEPTPYELVCGERRWRAAKLRGIGHLPAIIRELDDVEVLELQLIENIQRADVHPLEEADGYHDLIERHGYTVERIVQKTGKSRSWVYGRLKLCELVPEVREAFLADKLGAQVALALARLPAVELQVEALAVVTGKVDRDVDDLGIQAPRLAAADADPYDGEAQPLTTKQSLAYLERRFMLDLRLAKFPVDDSTLVPDVGDCKGCVYRTGNQPDLFAADVASDDKCTRPPCYERKNRAWFERAAATAKQRGVKILPAKETEVVFPRGNDTVADQRFVEPSAHLDYRDGWTDWQKKAPTFEALLGKEMLAKVPRVLVQAPSGAAVELLDRAAALKLAKEAGKLAKKKPSTAADNGEAAARKKLELRRAVVERVLPRLASAAAGAFRGDNVPKDSTEWWRWLASAVVDKLGADDVAAAARTLKLDPKAVRGVSSYEAPRRAILAELASETATPAAIRYVLAVCLVGGGGAAAAGSTWSPKYSTEFVDAAKRWKVDVDKVAADVAAERKATESAKAAKKKPAPRAGRKAARK